MMHSEPLPLPGPGDQPQLRKSLCEMCGDERLLFIEGFDDCVAGIVEEYGRVPRVAYDVDRVFDVLRDRLHVPEDKLERVFEDQIASCNLGPYSPALLITPPANSMIHRHRSLP